MTNRYLDKLGFMKQASTANKIDFKDVWQYGTGTVGLAGAGLGVSNYFKHRDEANRQRLLEQKSLEQLKGIHEALEGPLVVKKV